MGFKSDIEIAQEAKPLDIREIGKKLGLTEDDLELYGKYKAKVDYNLLKKETGKKAKLILTTAINPTPAGEGKTTTTIGVADALNKLGKNVLVALREPSLGPVFGIKGGAAGGVALAQLPRGCGRTQLYDARRHEGEHTEGAVLDDDCEAERQKILHIVKRKDDVGSG